MQAVGRSKPEITVVSPAYNEAENLPHMYDRLVAVFSTLGVSWEWVVVDDHSGDDTFGRLTALALQDERVRAVRLSRNFGSHAAVHCGLSHAVGNCAIVMAADLQDPPEVIPSLLEKWRQGAQVVWAAREQRAGEKEINLFFSRCYHGMINRLSGLAQVPPKGADFWLMDRVVIRGYLRFREIHSSTMLLIVWMGFRQETIGYCKQARQHGRSGWTLKKKLKLFIDSLTAFTHFPIRLMSYLGLFVATLGFLYALFIIMHAWVGHPVQGWSSLMVAILVLGGMQMGMLGILGEYLWRSHDESRRRPRYLIERRTWKKSANPSENRSA
ncbi:MAG: glycosyltransferase family 2 protein [Magnetococcales bacterium]|nr:glycosyltransferase family 2 protein [Magnetococcales bacterium]